MLIRPSSLITAPPGLLGLDEMAIRLHADSMPFRLYPSSSGRNSRIHRSGPIRVVEVLEGFASGFYLYCSAPRLLWGENYSALGLADIAEFIDRLEEWAHSKSIRLLRPLPDCGIHSISLFLNLALTNLWACHFETLQRIKPRHRLCLLNCEDTCYWKNESRTIRCYDKLAEMRTACSLEDRPGLPANVGRFETQLRHRKTVRRLLGVDCLRDLLGGLAHRDHWHRSSLLNSLFYAPELAADFRINGFYREVREGIRSAGHLILPSVDPYHLGGNRPA